MLFVCINKACGISIVDIIVCVDVIIGTVVVLEMGSQYDFISDVNIDAGRWKFKG